MDQPALPPAITGIEPPVVDFDAGAKLLVRGTNLAAPARLRFGEIDSLAVSRDGGLEAAIPPGLRAGVNPVRVVLGEPDATTPGLESADAMFVLRPHVADGPVFRIVQGSNGDATISVNVAPVPALEQPARLFLNPVPASDADPQPRGSAAPLRFAIAAAFAADLDGGEITPMLRYAFAAQGLRFGLAASVAVERPGAIWRLTDPQTASACRLARDGSGIAVHFGLPAADPGPTLAFALRDVPAGRYLVSVQIGDIAFATSLPRWDEAGGMFVAPVVTVPPPGVNS